MFTTYVLSNKHCRPGPDRNSITVRSVSKRLARIAACLIAFAVWLSGCAAPEKQTLQTLSTARYPDFKDDIQYDGLEHSIRQSLSYLQRVPPEREFHFEDNRYSAAHMTRSLESFLAYIQTQPSQSDLNRYIRNHYQVYRSVGSGPDNDVLFTGYYEPFLTARRIPNSRYRVPILGRPDDLVTVDLAAFSSKYQGEKLTGRLAGRTIVPYFERKDIEGEGALDGMAPVLAWLEDPVDLFFLQIQGSGRVYLDNGDALNVHYDSTNGHPYRSIGRLLIDKGKIPLSEMSMQRIRSYLAAHPEQARDIMDYNPSYVFFRLEEDGPLGYLNVKLTPGRSIALDFRLFPMPALSYIETAKPIIDGNGEITRWENFSRFVVSQDTGGAIRGPGRADIFWGNGPYAEVAAGHMRQRGNLYLMILKSEDGR
jgi:membrane-bound lytic murein transglycosylase A